MSEERPIQINAVTDSHVKKSISSRVDYSPNGNCRDRRLPNANLLHNSVVDGDVTHEFRYAPPACRPTGNDPWAKIPIVNAALQIAKLLFPGLFALK